MRYLEVYGSYALYRRLGSLGRIAILLAVIMFSKFAEGIYYLFSFLYGAGLSNAFDEVSGDTKLV